METTFVNIYRVTSSDNILHRESTSSLGVASPCLRTRCQGIMLILNISAHTVANSSGKSLKSCLYGAESHIQLFHKMLLHERTQIRECATDGETEDTC